MLEFYEFFAGGGMVRAGLDRSAWHCRFANDFDRKKAATYSKNWGSNSLKVADIRLLGTTDLPGRADLAWASFPCQDLSLAGAGAGLKGNRSGTFWPFWRLIQKLNVEGRAPRIVALENVCGTLTSHQGKDFSAICAALSAENYSFGALVIDAAYFVPQSRPRLFVIGVHENLIVPASLVTERPVLPWHTGSLVAAVDKISPQAKDNWVWWSLPEAKRSASLAALVEENPKDVDWHTPAETRQLLSMMSDVNRAKVDAAMKLRRRTVGTLYKRTRRDEVGGKVQRAEVRFDEIAGCLRTPAGGSSRQLVLVVEGDTIRSRLMSARETARLMGLSDDYSLPKSYNEAYHLTGDGVVVPVVQFLAKELFRRVLEQKSSTRQAAA